MPHCYTALEELIYAFGGPWLFGFILLSLLVLLALVLSVARMKFVGADELPGRVPARRASPIDRSFPFLESLNEVCCAIHLLSFLFQMNLLSHIQSKLTCIYLTLFITCYCWAWWLFFRCWKPTELRSHEVTCTECISWGPTHFGNPGIFNIPHPRKLKKLC